MGLKQRRGKASPEHLRRDMVDDPREASSNAHLKRVGERRERIGGGARGRRSQSPSPGRAQSERMTVLPPHRRDDHQRGGTAERSGGSV